MQQRAPQYQTCSADLVHVAWTMSLNIHWTLSKICTQPISRHTPSSVIYTKRKYQVSQICWWYLSLHGNIGLFHQRHYHTHSRQMWITILSKMVPICLSLAICKYQNNFPIVNFLSMWNSITSHELLGIKSICHLNVIWEWRVLLKAYGEQISNFHCVNQNMQIRRTYVRSGWIIAGGKEYKK